MKPEIADIKKISTKRLDGLRLRAIQRKQELHRQEWSWEEMTVHFARIMRTYRVIDEINDELTSRGAMQEVMVSNQVVNRRPSVKRFGVLTY